MKSVSWLCAFGLAVCTAFAEEVKKDGPMIEVVVRFIEVEGGKELKDVNLLWGDREDWDLLAAPQVLTKSGEQATLKITTEYIYPTNYTVRVPPNDLPGAQKAILITPQNFIKQEAGVTVDITPIWNPDDKTIDLDITPAILSGPIWHEFEYVDEQRRDVLMQNGEKFVIPLDDADEGRPKIHNVLLPVFPTFKVTGKLKLQDGVQTVFGGFRDVTNPRKRTLYFLVTAFVLNEKLERKKEVWYYEKN